MKILKPKIIEGHSFEEYKKLYGAYLATHPTAHVLGSKVSSLKGGRKYWKIGDDYYLIPINKKVFIPVTASSAAAIIAGTTMIIGATAGGWFRKPDTPTPPTPVGDKVKITFDPKDGDFKDNVITIDNATAKVIEVNKGTKWGEIQNKPIPTPKSGETEFKSYTINSEEIKDDYVFNVDTTVSASYVAKVVQVSVTFDPDGGDFPTENGESKTIKVNKGTKWSEVSGKPSNPTKDKFIFKFWSQDGTTEIASDYVINSDLNVKAIYVDAVTVTFDADGGVFNSNDPTKDVVVESGTLWKDVKKPKDPTKSSTETVTYTFECWKLNDAKIEETKEISGNITVKASYIEKEADPFELATWYEVVTIAQKDGFKGLVEKYRKGETSPTFVGCERTVKVKDNSNGVKEYKVRVVDEQADELGEESKEILYGVLTFEFEEVLNIDNAAFNTNTKSNNKWEESTLRTSLNNAEDENSIFNKIVEPLDDGEHKNELLNGKFLEIKKKTNSSGTSTTNDKLFLPSLSELGVKYIPGSNPQVQVDDEGTVYKNYNSDNNSYTKVKGKDKHGYWLRSDDADNEGKVWYVNNNGKISDSKVSTDTSLGVAPCFCIGVTDNKINVTYSLGEDTSIHFSDEERSKSFETTKNTTYTAFKKNITIPTVTKEPDDQNSYEFKHWYYLDGNSKVEITEDYLLQDYNLVLYPEFEAKPKVYKPGISFELTNENPVTISFSSNLSTKPTLKYSYDDGTTYTPVNYSSSPEITLTSNGNKKVTISSADANNSTISSSTDENKFTTIKVDEVNNTSGGRVKVYGDLRTLLDATKYTSIITAPKFCFNKLFAGDYSGEDTPSISVKHTGIEDASGLSLGVNVAGEGAFKKMMMCNVNMKTAPTALTPTQLGEGSYFGMFACCSSLINPPTLADLNKIDGTYTYYKLFHHCTSLKTGPKLYSTILGTWAYGSMFKGCTSLEVAPELPDNMKFIDGTHSHLRGMFIGCTSLKVAPKKLSALTALPGSYEQMFQGCINLENGPEICATTVSPRTTSANIDAEESLYQMFDGCTKLNYVKIYYADIYADNNDCFKEWMINTVTPSTEYPCIFECPSSTTITGTRSSSKIPNGWSIKTF